MTYISTLILTLATLTPAAQSQVSLPASHTREPIALDSQGIWSHFAGSAKRNSVPTLTHTPSLTTVAWENTDHTPIPQSGLVVDHLAVYAITRDQHNQTLAVALDRTTGEELWSTPVASPILDSWSTPALDVEHHTLIVSTGATVVALDTSTGNPRWSADLDAIVVNASALVTHDLNDRDRVLITTYSFGGGAPASLVCINTDPFDASVNLYEPGDIVWTKNLSADSSGNTPAYQSGRVYLATASSGSSQRGTVRCYDITSDTPPASPLWTFTNTINAGFFGGVAIARGHIYASSYSFTGLQTSANTVKLNKNTGDLVWSVSTNRTDATPIVLPGGDVIVSSGVATGAFDFLPFFGSLPSIQYIDDQGTTALLAWDSALETHDDLNSNGIWDFGEPFLSIGGWTHQPVALSISGTPHLLVGTLPESRPGISIDHNTDLRLIDLTASPTDPGFIVDHASATGNTPAFASGWVFTSGPTGIRAYAPASPLLKARTLIDRYTHGDLTLKQLMEQLPR